MPAGWFFACRVIWVELQSVGIYLPCHRRGTVCSISVLVPHPAPLSPQFCLHISLLAISMTTHHFPLSVRVPIRLLLWGRPLLLLSRALLIDTDPHGADSPRRCVTISPRGSAPRRTPAPPPPPPPLAPPRLRRSRLAARGWRLHARRRPCAGDGAGEVENQLRIRPTEGKPDSFWISPELANRRNVQDTQVNPSLSCCTACAWTSLPSKLRHKFGMS